MLLRVVGFVTFMLGCAMCAVAEESSVVEFNGQRAKSYIIEALKPVISKVLSNHTPVIGCNHTSCSDDPFGPKIIETPADVYCYAKKDCCIHHKQQRNAEQYCDCYANQLRKKSYELENITPNAFYSMQMNNFTDTSCNKYYDGTVDLDTVYKKLFLLCKSKNSNVEFCDILATTTKQLIEVEMFAKQEKDIKQKQQTNANLTIAALYVAAPYVSKTFTLYESEYTAIAESNEFMSLLQQQ